MPASRFEIAPEEMGLARHPAELAAWVRHTCELLGESKEAKSYGRSGSQWPKKFVEEVRPLSIYAAEKYGLDQEVTVQPNLGNENFDGVIRIFDGEPVFVEITSAKDGYTESLRMEALEVDGHVNALGRVEVSGRRSSPDRQVTVCDEAVNHNHLVGENLAIVADRLRDKSDSRYSERHVLLIVVDDYIPFRESREIGLHEGLVKTQLKLHPAKFKSVAVIGQSGRVLFELQSLQGQPENAL